MPKKAPPLDFSGNWGIYNRRSTDDPRKQRMSLPDQHNCNNRKFDELAETEKAGREKVVYPDEKKSAFHPDKRVVFKKIVADIEAKKLYGLMAVEFTRVSRNPQETGVIVQLMKDGKLKCFVASTSGRTYWWNSADDIMALMVDGGIGCKESMNRSVVVTSRMDERAKEGKPMGRKLFGFKPHVLFHEDGYEERITLVDDKRLPQLIEIYKLAAKGRTLEEIVEWAREKNVRNRSGNLLKGSTISDILHNPYSKGFNRHDGEEYPWKEEHIPKMMMPNGELCPIAEPPVSASLWNRANIMMASRANGAIKDVELRRLFKCGSVIHCGKCGYALSPYRVIKKKT